MRQDGESNSPAPPPDRWPALFDGALLSWSRSKRLTYTERAVVRCAVQGQSNKEIGRTLGMATSTVGTHLEHVMRKVDVSSRTELAFRFFSEALPPLLEKRGGPA
jgi:DNA-binding CsgD family transcriptional regulator